MTYKQINNLTGWLVFAISATTYILTSEPTTSFWDCGEYIATASGLQVGHPPGAPLFQMVGRFFSLFSFGNQMMVARMVNTMSALCSAFTILFLFWTITHLATKALANIKVFFPNPVPLIIGSGLIGSLAYTFTDSFWFSAVEGEVYAMSSFFTAFVFWAILKWENESSEAGDGKDHSMRWIVLISFMIGLSIGVHLLNLLTIPAVSLVIYYKKFHPTLKGTTITLILSLVILALVMNFIIPWIVKLAGWSELLFVNTFGLPFNTGTILYFIVIIGLIVVGLRRTYKKGKALLNLVILSFTFILIGYSSFFMLIIRSNANTPINENEPSNAISLLSYLNREQYGDWPLIYGPYYNAPVIDYKKGNPVYHKDSQLGKYRIINDRKDSEPVFDEEFMTIFPRMWSSTENSHEYFYKKFGGNKGVPIKVSGRDGKEETIYRPTFSENLRFFFYYQINHMYIRYFMWNFAGRQNDRQGLGELLNGNWLSGINFIDKLRLGPQDNLPASMKSKASNKYYFLPLILGLLGLVFQINRDPKNSLVVTLLFIMTGLAIVVYLNQYAPQPRERDYAYAASFYAFSIWIGLGVLSIALLLRKYLKIKNPALISTALCLTVPIILAAQNWDDHDRSGRYTAKDIARNYLESCDKDAILFTMGDNDTFPLWYAQEVEGIRRDVRVVNLSLLNSDWYIGQMKRKVYESEPLPISLTYEQFKSGTYDVMYVVPDERIKGAISLSDFFEVIHKQPNALKFKSRIGEIDIIPSTQFYYNIDTNKVISNGTVTPAEGTSVLKALFWEIKEKAIIKSQLVALDIIAHNNWERPIYFSATAGADSYLGLNAFLRNEGFALRLVPIASQIEQGYEGYIDSNILSEKLMKIYNYGNASNSSVYLDETNVRMFNNLRTLFGRLASKLNEENKKDQAIAACDQCLRVIPAESLMINYYLLPVAENYLKAGATDKGVDLLNTMLDNYTDDLEYYFRFPKKSLSDLNEDIRHALMVVNGIASLTGENNIQNLNNKATSSFDKYLKLYEQSGLLK
ncbi:MAG TPA: DUF2723 domain-containing protein [Lentimicrobium sp.]|nr:DUF2723 domain-containing protein [Lentimicrobium sp.]